ncbi:MAG: glycerate kinase [Phycisphaerales bacterium]|nr:glycerate kinase [Phycisphaerales bacterium]|tara:strand:+ start:8326 stop:9438 length:1113 start_codon:yes stop_codon:yes gene_type:complete
MNVLCAPDSFKDSISAADACLAMVRGADGLVESALSCPLADGGEGTMDVLVNACGGRTISVETLDPLGRSISARIGFLDASDMAIIEMAQASGLERLRETERNPFRTSSYGTGQLMAIAARDAGHILLAAGGTATMDGGCGIIQAFGGRILNSIGEPIEDPISNGMLSRIASIELPGGIPRIEIAVDVQAPLLGVTGAATMFGHQKGARPEDIDVLDANLLHLADVMDPEGIHRSVVGGGAAGGTAFGLHAMIGADIISGAQMVLERLDFRSRLDGTDLLMVGEGRLDEQSMMGKVPLAAARCANEMGIETVAICGTLGTGWEQSLVDNDGPIDHIITLDREHGLERSLQETGWCLEQTVRAFLRERGIR